MNQEKIDSGTVIVDQKSAEIGVIKKVYNTGLARLELTNSTSIALDISLIAEVNTTGRIIKKRIADIKPTFVTFRKGAENILEEVMVKIILQLARQLNSKETKKALQYFEFDILTEIELKSKLTEMELLGLARGIELANKTAQDFIVKSVFQAAEENPKIKSILAPEIIVDKLNQEKAFYRILWNVLRICYAQLQYVKSNQIVKALIDIIIEIGTKAIDIEYKSDVPDADILYWSNRLKEYIGNYIGAALLMLEQESQKQILTSLKSDLESNFKKIKVNSTIKEEIIKVLENLDLEDYKNSKTIELFHSGLKGFNLQVMSEKRAMKDLKEIISDLLEKKERSTIKVQNEINKFSREVRDVSKGFQDTLFEISQYLKKIEYGDSKVTDYFSELMDKLHNKKYFELGDILKQLRDVYYK